jgi:hypothetical protein
VIRQDDLVLGMKLQRAQDGVGGSRRIRDERDALRIGVQESTDHRAGTSQLVVERPFEERDRLTL